MAARTPIDRLSQDIAKILNEYQGEVQEIVRDIAADMGKKGAQAMKRESKARLNGSGKYAAGWKVDNSAIKNQRLTFSSVIYNERPGLPHLLEHGHVTRNGTGRTFGSTPAHEHIAPIEQELIEAFEREVTAKL